MERSQDQELLIVNSLTSWALHLFVSHYISFFFYFLIYGRKNNLKKTFHNSEIWSHLTTYKKKFVWWGGGGAGGSGCNNVALPPRCFSFDIASCQRAFMYFNYLYCSSMKSTQLWNIILLPIIMWPSWEKYFDVQGCMNYYKYKHIYLIRISILLQFINLYKKYTYQYIYIYIFHTYIHTYKIYIYKSYNITCTILLVTHLK